MTRRRRDISAEEKGQKMVVAKEPIWCDGALLHAVQLSGLFPDCKTFVDMPLKYEADVILEKWTRLQGGGQQKISNDVLAKFLRENFDEPEGELDETISPPDWNSTVDQFQHIVDQDYWKMACALHRKWPTLYRKIAKKVLINPSKYSILPVPHPFVVPGGRFREMYYWDSFFTIKGLIVSGMLETVRGMIDNMMHLIDEYGFVPNGTRVYYLNRSQPPLATWCVWAYFEATRNRDVLAGWLPTLRKELEFFKSKKSIKLDSWSSALYRYTVTTDRPRPESYREDVECAEHLDDARQRNQLWGDLAAAAESGRDFSSRWFSLHGPYAGKLESTRTSQIIPVELNAIIAGNIALMGRMYAEINDEAGRKWAELERAEICEMIHRVLWNEEHGVWFDYDLAESRQLETFNDTNFAPMYSGCYHSQFRAQTARHYLESSGALEFAGGVPSSLVNSGEQWDFPNSWAPTMWVIIEGFRKCGEVELAEMIADKWITKNFNMWNSSGGRMFEKYNVVSPCYKVKGGGEYVMQEGFGWTNGVILDLLNTYGDRLYFKKADTCECCDVNINRAPLSPAPSSNTPCLHASSTLSQTLSVASLQSLMSTNSANLK